MGRLPRLESPVPALPTPHVSAAMTVRAHAQARAQQIARWKAFTSHPVGECQACLNGYSHSIGEAPSGQVGATFSEGVSAAEAALRSLNSKARALLALTDVEDATDEDRRNANEARYAIRFASVTGPMSVARAKASQDFDELAQLQQGIRGVLSNVSRDLHTAIIDTFLGMRWAKTQVHQSADTIEKVLNTLDKPEQWPWWAYVAGGVVAVGVIGYTVRAFR